jgi:hypothetical protein
VRAAAALLLLALALTGCESSQEKSARLEKEAKRHVSAAVKGLSIERASTQVSVIASSVVNSSEGSAVVLTLRNLTGEALREVPLAITVRDSAGASVYTNDLPGLAHSLVSVALIPPHGQLTWIDDQVHASGGTPAKVSAEVGQAQAAGGTVPQIAVTRVHLSEGSPTEASAEGIVVNHSSVAQSELVVNAVAVRSGHIVAAGRAILNSLAAGGSASFQAFLVGSPKSAALTVSAPGANAG